MKEFEEILKKLRDNDPSLTELNLVGKKIGDSDVQALAEALKVNSNEDCYSLSLGIISC